MNIYVHIHVANLHTEMSKGHSFFTAFIPSLEMECAKSGVNGPLTWGSNCKNTSKKIKRIKGLPT